MRISKKKKTILVVVALMIAMMYVMPLNIFAATKPGQVTPLWVSIRDVGLDIIFDGSEGIASATARKQSASNLIEGTLYLYELVDGEWEYIDEIYNSKAVGTLSLDIFFDCTEGVTYKAVLTVTAYTNGVGETETFEHIETC